jgi:NitT/TauT family transport system ATP-binding protein
MIEITSLSLRYTGHGARALTSLTASWEAAGVTAILGRSGVGKSSLLSLIAGLYANTDQVVAVLEGAISIDGRQPTDLRKPMTASWVPQSGLLFEHRSVLENILLPIRAAGIRVGSEELQRARELMDRFGLAGTEQYRPKELSGGMAARVSLIRAIITDPEYLFLDEPFNGLDLFTRWRLYELIRSVRDRPDRATFFATHNVPEAAILADRIVLLEGTSEKTDAEIIANDPVPITAFSGGEGLATARVAAAAIERRLFERLAKAQDPPVRTR